MLVGGGELHDRWSSLVGVSAPLSPGIQRFTGITQAMVDGAPRAGGRAARAGRAAARARAGRPQRRASTSASCARPSRAPGSTGRTRPSSARSRWRAARAAAAPARPARRWPRRSASRCDTSHRALPDAETCARVFCALFEQLCANAADGGRGGGAGGRTRPQAPRRPRRAAPIRARPGFARLPPRAAAGPGRGCPTAPASTSSATPTAAPLYVGKSVDVRTRARSHFTAGAAWAGAGRAGRLRGDALRARRAAARAPADPRAQAAGQRQGHVREPDGYVYLRCRLDIPFPILEVAREPAAGHAVCIGPVRGRAAAAELVEQLNSLFGLRHCGRTLPRRDDAVGLRADGALPLALPRRPRPEPLPRAAGGGAAAVRRRAANGAGALLGHVDAQMRAAAAERNYERAATLRRRHDAARVAARRASAASCAPIHAGARLVVAPHPKDAARADAVWIAGGRVARLRVAARGARRACRAHAPRRCAQGRAARRSAAWLPCRRARRGADGRRLARANDATPTCTTSELEARDHARPARARRPWTGQCTRRKGSSTTVAVAPSAVPTSVDDVAGRRLAAHEGQRDRAEGGRDDDRAERPTSRSPSCSAAPDGDRRATAAARAGGGSACPCRRAARPSPGRRSSPW